MATQDKVNPSNLSQQTLRIDPERLRGIKLAILMAIFGLITASVMNGVAQNIDLGISNWIYSLKTPGLTKLMFGLTSLGSTPFIAIAAAIIVIVLRMKNFTDRANLFLITLTTSVLLDNLLKYLIQRQRPNIAPLDNGITFSFPSGHATNSLVFYGLLLYLAGYWIKNKNLLYAIDAAVMVLIVFIGISRVYLGAHYPSDVIGGFALGSFVVCAAIAFAKSKKVSLAAR